MSEYGKQASYFLAKYGISMHIGNGTEKKAPWAKDKECGLCHIVSLRAIGRDIHFPFWNSINAKKKGIEPSAYDILACIAADINCPDDFKEFCSDYGYSDDSISALKTFERCNAFATRLQAFFTYDEIEALQEIQ